MTMENQDDSSFDNPSENAIETTPFPHNSSRELFNQPSLSCVQVSDQSPEKEDSSEFLTLNKLQYSLPPAKDICSLAVCTFEKMALPDLRELQQFDVHLREGHRVSFNELKRLTIQIMEHVWRNDIEMTQLLESDPTLTRTLGKELLVLFDNVVAEPLDDSTTSGKSQRYTRACLDNAILPLYDDDLSPNSPNTFERVISTYTSPTAFTPEMELLIRKAVSLGIPTGGLDLKNFITERSLSAFLQALIRAKMKKKSFINNNTSNIKLKGVLNYFPETSSKFKYSQKKPQSSDESSYNNQSSEIRKLKSKLNTKILDKQTERNSSMHCQRSKEIKKNINCVSSKTNNGPNKFGSNKKLGSRIFSSTPDKVSSRQRMQGDKCNEIKKTQVGRNTNKPAALRASNCWLKNKNRRSNHLDFITQSSSGLGLLTEQQSFFRLGKGAQNDSLRDYVEAKTGASEYLDSNKYRKKRVRWLDQIPSTSLYSASSWINMDDNEMHEEMERTLIGKMLSKIGLMNTNELSVNYINNSGLQTLYEKPLKSITIKAIAQATILTITVWTLTLLYIATPDVADRIRRFVNYLGFDHFKNAVQDY